jgi:protein-export membrane protein SecD
MKHRSWVMLILVMTWLLTSCASRALPEGAREWIDTLVNKSRLQLLLEADIPPDQQADFDARIMEAARAIIECRAKGLGVSRPLVQLQGEQQIIVELPDIDDYEQVAATLHETGLLEFVEAGHTPLAEGMRIHTSLDAGSESVRGAISSTGTVTQTEYAYADRVFTTIMTGRDLKDAGLSVDKQGEVVIAFELTPEGAKIFRDYTSHHVGNIVGIVLDKVVASAPVINQPITQGKGIISSNQPGGFPLEEARDFAVKMKCGALPVQLRVVEVRPVASP